MKYLYDERYSVDSSETITYITVDPAGGTSPENAGPRTDKWGFCVNSVSMDNKWFIQDMYAKHLDEAMFMQELWTLDTLWHPYRIGIEKTQHLKAYIGLEFARKGKTLPIVDLVPKGRRKERRIMGLASMLSNIYFNSKIAGSIQHEMQRWYTDQEHGDDALDALAYQIDIATAPTQEMIAENKRMIEESDTKQALERLPMNQRIEWEGWIKKEKELKYGVPVNEEFMRMYDY